MRELKTNLKFAWKYAKSEKKRIITFGILNLLSVIVNIITPIFSAKIIVKLISNDYMQILFIASIILLTDIIEDLLHYRIRFNAQIIYKNLLNNLEISLGESILKLENKCLDDNGSGIFIQRMTNDTSRIANVFNEVLSLVLKIVKNIGVLVAIAIVNVYVFIFVVIMLLIMYILEKIRTDKREKDDRVVRKSKEKISGFIGELVRGARDIKMLNSEKDFINELSIKIEDANQKDFNMHTTSWNYKVIIWIIMNTTQFLLIVLLVLLMKKNIILPAIALVLYKYVDSTYSSIFLIGDLLNYVKDFNLSAERINKIINSDDFKKETFGSVHLDKVNGNFSFNNVDFTYDKKPVLNKLTFNVEANQTVAFVGKSGAGKSTIFSLLCKMYPVKDNSIFIDGIDINKLDKDSIRGNITVISQNPYIFNLSIKDNFRLVKSNVTDKEIKEACRAACLDDFIKTLPNKYDTIIGEGGINLSGGQKQRFAIARALIQKTEIILFDEATSALDNETQDKIQKAIDNMKNEYTILIIAHRLSTIINADKIIFIEDGKVVQEGSHKKLLRTCKAYKELYNIELKNGEQNANK